MTSSDVSCTSMTGRSQRRLKSTRTAAVGRVLPATAFIRATPAQRDAGIQYPVAVGSVLLGNEGRQAWPSRRSPRLNRRSESVTVDDVVPKINDRQVVASPVLPFPCSGLIRDARHTGAPCRRLRAREFTVSAPNPSIARKPAWMLDFALEIYRQLENRPDGKSPPGTQRDIDTVRFTVRLNAIPAIDLDRSRQTSRQAFAPRVSAPDLLFNRPR